MDFPVDQSPIESNQLASSSRRSTRETKFQAQKHDPKHVKQARELRDRFLEDVNSGRLLPGGESGDSGGGKYDVSRQIGTDAQSAEVTQSSDMIHLLDAA